jgi:hypothetical protein
MAWPDLTLVAEGPTTRIVWAPDKADHFRPIRFASSGGAVLCTPDVLDGLARIVDHVLGRLAEEGRPKTRLAEEWEAIARSDDDEREFCRTAARLGLDPYSISDQMATEIIDVASSLPDELAADFFDNAEPSLVTQAARWTSRALSRADKAARKAREILQPLYEATGGAAKSALTAEKPWAVGYAMARQVRREVGVQDTDRFDPSPWLGVGDIKAPSGGIQGIATVEEGRCGLVLGDPRPPTTGLFRRARAMGRVLARPQQHSFVLSAARSHDERVAGAFAAELLAPAEGIRKSLDALGKHDEAALEAVAWHFDVSPLLVRHQFDNQLAKVSDKGFW